MRLGLLSTRLRLKVIEHSFLVPMRYSSLFSTHWQLGGNCQWLDASSTKKDYTVAMATLLVINQH